MKRHVHKWLLMSKEPKIMYADNFKGRDYIYHYQCQVCGKWMEQPVVNLDNAPKSNVGDDDGADS